MTEGGRGGGGKGEGKELAILFPLFPPSLRLMLYMPLWGLRTCHRLLAQSVCAVMTIYFLNPCDHERNTYIPKTLILSTQPAQQQHPPPRIALHYLPLLLVCCCPAYISLLAFFLTNRMCPEVSTVD